MSASTSAVAERDRLRALAAYAVLDTEDEPAFTVLVDSAASLLGVRRSAITLLDARREWRKATHGPALRQAPRAWSLCADVVAAAAPLAIADLRQDRGRRDNPLAHGPEAIRCYAGAPLIGRDGLALGDLSVSDGEPREFTDRDLSVLTALAAAAVALLEQRRDALVRSFRPAAPVLTQPAVTRSIWSRTVRQPLPA